MQFQIWLLLVIGMVFSEIAMGKIWMRISDQTWTGTYYLGYDSEEKIAKRQAGSCIRKLKNKMIFGHKYYILY
jgi:hypothetical protein